MTVIVEATSDRTIERLPYCKLYILFQATGQFRRRMMKKSQPASRLCAKRYRSRCARPFSFSLDAVPPGRNANCTQADRSPQHNELQCRWPTFPSAPPPDIEALFLGEAADRFPKSGARRAPANPFLFGRFGLESFFCFGFPVKSSPNTALEMRIFFSYSIPNNRRHLNSRLGLPRERNVSFQPQAISSFFSFRKRGETVFSLRCKRSRLSRQLKPP